MITPCPIRGVVLDDGAAESDDFARRVPSCGEEIGGDIRDVGFQLRAQLGEIILRAMFVAIVARMPAMSPSSARISHSRPRIRLSGSSTMASQSEETARLLQPHDSTGGHQQESLALEITHSDR